MRTRPRITKPAARATQGIVKGEGRGKGRGSGRGRGRVRVRVRATSELFGSIKATEAVAI